MICSIRTTALAAAFAVLAIPLHADPVNDRIALLKDPSAEVRAGAASDLATFGEGARPAIPALVAALEDGDPRVRRNALLALGLAKADDPDSTRAIAKRLLDSDPEIGSSARKTLIGFVSRNPETAGVLVENLTDPHGGFAWLCSEVLLDSRSATTRKLPEIAAIADSSEATPIARSLALKLMGSVGRGRPELIDRLLLSMDDPDPVVARGAAEGLGHAGQAGERGVPGLRRMLASEDLQTRVIAAKALGRIGPGAGDAGPDLIPLAESGDPVMREIAIEALGKVQNPVALEALERMTRDPDANLRGTAASAMARLKVKQAKEGETPGTKAMGRSRKPQGKGPNGNAPNGSGK